MRLIQVMLTLSILAGSALAAPQTDGARNSAMGGTGVASSDYLNAAFVNPAALTKYSIEEDDDWGLLLPTFGVLVSDPDSLIDALEDFTDSVDIVDDAYNSGTVTQGQLNNLADDLASLAGRSLYLQVDAGAALAIPSKYFSTALMINSYVDAQAFLSIDGADDAAIRNALSGTELPDLASEAIAIGAVVTEVGLALGKEFEIGDSKFSFGVTPKMQRLEVFSIGLAVDDDSEDIEDDYDAATNRADDTALNLDLGALYHATDSWTIGLAVRDALGPDLATPGTATGPINKYTLSPVVTAGTAWRGETFTLAADLDLTQHERFGNGVESQFLRVGAEMGWTWAQFRVGYQYDIEDGTNDIATAGIGFSPFGVFHMDLAAAAGQDTYGVVLSTSFTF